jgi:ketosteroid isomerase-like protein
VAVHVEDQIQPAASPALSIESSESNPPFGRVATGGVDRREAIGDMMIHAEITPTEQADRLAIRELVDAYAHCADRRDAAGQAALFTEDTHFVVYMNGQASEPTQVLDGREALTPVFDDLNRYQATMHFNGQSTIVIDGVGAIGETYCIAHHLFADDDEGKLMIAWLRYGDTFVKVDGVWLFAKRNLYVDWTETRPITATA